MKDQASKQAEEETLVTELKDTKEKDDEKAEEEEENEEEELQERQADIVEEAKDGKERQMIGQENSDHQYSSGDYKHQAKESLEDQSKMEGREEEEEEGEEEEEAEEDEEEEESHLYKTTVCRWSHDNCLVID